MKRRYRRMLNFFSFSLLLVALYLNFVKNETADDSASPISAKIICSNSLERKELKAQAASQPEHTIVLK